MNQILIAPNQKEVSGPIVFLAGPIQGARDWQSDAINIIQGLDETINIASPRRKKTRSKNFTSKMYFEQVDWEHQYLRQAGKSGAILFWLSCEETHDCTRAYAQTTRFELGEACVMDAVYGPRVAVGIEEGFSNARYLRHTIKKKFPGIPLCDTLEATCQATLKIARAR